MYKMYLYLKGNDEDLINTFSTKTIDVVKELNKEFSFGVIEGSALTEEKFSRVIEVTAKDVKEMNEALISAEGKNLTRHLSNHMGHITTFFAEFED